MQKINEEYCKMKRPEIKVGDNVKLHMKIKEGDKSRIQIYEGIVISIKGSGINKNIVVRKISNGVGVEKIVPLYSPIVEKIEVVKRGSVITNKKDLKNNNINVFAFYGLFFEKGEVKGIRQINFIDYDWK